MNTDLEEGTVLPLMEAFYTIQGEGFYTGSSAYFLRIGGCDVGCHWCDVKESWDVETHPTTKVEEMIFPILEYPSNTVVVTGGEPLMWDMHWKAMERIIELGFADEVYVRYNTNLSRSATY